MPRDPQLDKLIQDLKTKKFRDGEAQGLVKTIGDEIQRQLTPAFQGLAKELKSEMSQAFKDAVSSIKVDMPEMPTPQITVESPEVVIPEIKVPEPKVTVNVEKPDAPIVNIPETVFPDTFALRDVDSKRPLPVRLFDADGKPFQMSMSSGIGGGRGDFFTIKDIQTSSGASIIDQTEGAVKVTGSLSATTTPFATYYASDAVGSMNLVQYGGSDVAKGSEDGSGVFRVRHVSDVGLSVSVTDIFGSVGTNLINPDNRLKVELPTGSSGLTDAELRASAVPVSQVSGASWSTSASIVSVTDIFSTTATSSVVNTDNRVKVELPATTITAVTDITNSVRMVNLDRDNNPWQPYAYDNGDAASAIRTVFAGNSVASTSIVSQTVTLETRQVSGAADSVTISSQPITLVVQQLSGASDSVAIASQPITLDVRQVSGAMDSVIVTGAADSFFAYEVMTTNKTAKSDGADIRPKADDLGRQVMRPIQVRDLIKTAYVSVTNGTETTLLAATAGAYNDLIMIVGSNNSDAAVSVDIRAVSAGNIVNTLRIPANGTAGWTPHIPWPQDATGNNWTVDGPDETGRTLTFSALFSTEV